MSINDYYIYRNERDFVRYLELLSKTNYIILVVSKDTPCHNYRKFSLDIIKMMKEIGIEQICDKFRYSYLACIHQKKVMVEEYLANDLVHWESASLGIGISMISTGYKKDVKQLASAKVNGIEYSVNKRGLNFIVFDIENKCLVDSVCFDTFSDEVICMRKIDILPLRFLYCTDKGIYLKTDEQVEFFLIDKITEEKFKLNYEKIEGKYFILYKFPIERFDHYYEFRYTKSNEEYEVYTGLHSLEHFMYFYSRQGHRGIIYTSDNGNLSLTYDTIKIEKTDNWTFYLKNIDQRKNNSVTVMFRDSKKRTSVPIRYNDYGMFIDIREIITPQYIEEGVLYVYYKDMEDNENMFYIDKVLVEKTFTFEIVDKKYKTEKKIIVQPYQGEKGFLAFIIKEASFKSKTFVTKSGFKIDYFDEVTGDNYRNKLIVGFPHNSPHIGDIKDSKYYYHYTGMMKNIGVRKLYLKDAYGKNGSWFIGFNGSQDHAKELIEFLNYYIEEHNIKKEDIVFFGASKGGWNALFFGYLLGIKNIVVSMPVFNFYDFVLVRPALREILPQNITDDVIYKYNHLLSDIILSSNTNPNVHVITADKDELAPYHMPALVETLEKKKANYQIIKNVNPNIVNHNNATLKSQNEILEILYKLINE